MTNYPFFVGDGNQQLIEKPNDIIYAWGQVSAISLTPSKDDVFQIVPVEAMLVENSLNGKKLPPSLKTHVAINWTNPINGMERYEILPISSNRFNIQSIPPNPIVFQDLDGSFLIQKPLITPINSNILILIFSIITLFSLENNRNN